MLINHFIVKLLFINTCWLVLICISCVPVADSVDVDEANEIFYFIQPYFDIQPEQCDGISEYADPGGFSTEIIIYRMIKENEQNRLIQILRTEKTNRKWKTIKINFYNKEVLVKKENSEVRKN